MATITLGGNTVHTNGEVPEKGTKLIDFKLVNTDLETNTLADFKGKKLVLNIFPSVETGTCSASVREFNKAAAALENTLVLCISRDLPFAQKRFCGAEGLNDVIMLSDYKNGDFGTAYGIRLLDGAFSDLLSRVVIVTDENGVIQYTEQVSEIANEPNYELALAAL